MVAKNLEELSESFALFENWEDRYRYLIDLGQRLPPMDPALKTDAHFVRGCTSRVWLVAHSDNGQWHFIADSDAQIVRGLIYLILTAYQGRTTREILDYDITAAFEALGLHQHLSPNRRNGFYAMVERIRQIARAA